MRPGQRRRTAVAAAALMAAASCSRGPAPTGLPPAPSTAPTAPATTATPATTTAPATAPPATAPPTAAPATTAAPPPPACPPVPERAGPSGQRSRYRLRVDVRPAENVVDGETAVVFVPDVETDRLVFRLWPNGPRTARAGARLETGAVQVDGRQVDAALESPTVLVVRPGGTLAAGRSVEASVPWRLTLPAPVDDRISRSGDVVRLGSFFPILAWEPGVGWAVEPPTSGFAEASTAPAADFAATVTVPPGSSVLATGTTDGSGRWTASGVPDFALSVGRFTTATATVAAPEPVQVTVGVAEGIAEPPAPYLSRATRALQDFSRRYGPYPWPSYSVAVTPHLGGGIEYPMHVLQGPGTSGRTTAHEVAHMWFYGLVANDQGRDPWLDEGLASWAEARFEGSLAALRAKEVPLAGRGHLGEPMSFWEPRQAIYYRSVYVQGVQALAALGPPDLVDCALRLYVARAAYRVARPGDLVAAAEGVLPGAGRVLAGFGVRA